MDSFTAESITKSFFFKMTLFDKSLWIETIYLSICIINII